MRFLKLRPKLFLACSGFLLLTTNAQAAWIGAYGVPNVDQSYGLIERLPQGGYIVTGLTGYLSGQVNWYARLDEQGQIVWSKSLGNVHPIISGDGSVQLFEIQPANNSFVSVSGSGELNIETGDITNVVVEKNISKILSVGTQQFSYADRDGNIIAGEVKVNENNTDAGLAKLDSNDNVVWSHSYDFGTGDMGPGLEKLSTGYLLSFNSIEIDGETLAEHTYTILAKLNDDGSIVSGSARKLVGGFETEVLADESVALLSEEEANNLQLIKLDKQLDPLWGKRYSLSGAKDLMYGGMSEQVNGTLEITATHRRLNNEDEEISKHPLQIRINSATGAILQQAEFQVRTFDPDILAGSSPLYNLWGTTADSLLHQDQDGIIAKFDGNLTPNWVRTLMGSKYDITYVSFFDSAANYRLTGQTESWGAGNVNLLFGQLDKNGTVAECAALHDVTPTIISPNLVVEDLVNPTSNITLTDNGNFPVTVVNSEDQHTLPVNPTSYPLVATNICSAAEPEPSGIISLSATELSFGNVPPGSKVNAQLVVSNHGDGDLTISGISAPNLPFKKISDQCSGQTITPNGVCTVAYQFAPTTLGEVTAELTISSNDPDHSNLSFNLSGKASSDVLPLQFTSLSSSIVGVGGEVTLTGQGFTAKKGKVLFGKKPATIISWSDNSINLKPPKIKAGIYSLNIVTKTNGSVSAGQLSLSVPQVSNVLSGTDTPYLHNIEGHYFGIGKAKPKVSLVLGKKNIALTVLPGYSDTLIRVKRPKKLKSGTYNLVVSNSAGKSLETFNLNF